MVCFPFLTSCYIYLHLNKQEILQLTIGILSVFLESLILKDVGECLDVTPPNLRTAVGNCCRLELFLSSKDYSLLPQKLWQQPILFFFLFNVYSKNWLGSQEKTASFLKCTLLNPMIGSAYFHVSLYTSVWECAVHTHEERVLWVHASQSNSGI